MGVVGDEHGGHAPVVGAAAQERAPARVSEDSVRHQDAEALPTVLDSLAGQAMDRGRIPGLAVVLVHEGELVWSRGYGRETIDGGPSVSPQATRFPVGSVSKLVTAVAAMQQVEDGRLSLHADVRRYVPDSLPPPGPGGPVTVRFAPRAAEIDESNQSPDDLWRKLGELGLLGITIPDELGGADMGYLKYGIFLGDGGIFSVTLAASPEDAPLRALLRRERLAEQGGPLEEPLFSGPIERCPTCGGRVYMPCVACKVRASAAQAVPAVDIVALRRRKIAAMRKSVAEPEIIRRRAA